jgi:hypothetical protein
MREADLAHKPAADESLVVGDHPDLTPLISEPWRDREGRSGVLASFRACVGARACLRLRVRACVCMRVRPCVRACVRARVRAYARACVRAYARACVHACVPVDS